MCDEAGKVDIVEGKGLAIVFVVLGVAIEVVPVTRLVFGYTSCTHTCSG